MNRHKYPETFLTKSCLVRKPLKRHKTKNAQSSICKYGEVELCHLWKNIKTKIISIENECYQSTFSSILNFIRTCIKLPQQIDEIPAAVLQMGVNIQDHVKIFKNLEHFLRLNKNYAIILESSKCTSFSNAVRILNQEIENQSNICLASPQKLSSANRKSNLKPIVIMMQDVENFNVNILQELIFNCKIYKSKLPIILLFGMSTTMITLHKILPHNVLCNLGIETFHSVAANECLTRIIEEVVMSPSHPFKLGPKVLKLVIDTILYHDFSVTNLCKLLRFSLIEHFLYNKGATLCCHESELEEKVQHLQTEELNFLRNLPSIELYKHNNPDVALDLDNHFNFKKLLIKLLKNFIKFQKSFVVNLRVLHCLIKDLPGCPLGKHLREVYLLAIEKKIYVTSQFKDCASLLKMQSPNELLSKFESCLSLFPLKDLNTTKKLFSILKDSVEKLGNLSSEDYEKIHENTFKLENNKIMSRFQLQEKIRLSIQHKRSKFDALRSEIIDNIFEYFNDLNPPSMVPLHEIFYFNEVHTLKKHLMPTPRITLQNALANPRIYFQCDCCKIDVPEQIECSMPDICVLYKLHLEGRKLINLCDWLESFKTVKKKKIEKECNKRSAHLNKVDFHLNNRFLHTASELQLLGFIKPTKRKTDHIAKLTFSIF